jgi:hypothetical protein
MATRLFMCCMQVTSSLGLSMFTTGQHGMVYMREAAGRLTRREPPLLLKKGLARTGRASLYSHGRCLLIAAGAWVKQQEGEGETPVPAKQQQKQEQQQQKQLPRSGDGEPEGQAPTGVAAARTDETAAAAGAGAGGAVPEPESADEDTQPQQPPVRAAAEQEEPDQEPEQSTESTRAQGGLAWVMGDLVSVLRQDGSAVQVCTLLDLRVSPGSESRRSAAPNKGLRLMHVEDRGQYCYVVHFSYR